MVNQHIIIQKPMNSREFVNKKQTNYNFVADQEKNERKKNKQDNMLSDSSHNSFQMLEKFSKQTHYPFDKVLMNIEFEELLEEDDITQFLRVSQATSTSMLHLIKQRIQTQQEQNSIIQFISKYEQIEHQGLLSIQRWSYNLQLDKKQAACYTFIFIHQPVLNSIDNHLEKMNLLGVKFFQQDFLNIMQNLTSGLALLFYKNLNFDQIVPSNIFVSQEGLFKFIGNEIFLNKSIQSSSLAQYSLYAAPEEKNSQIPLTGKAKELSCSYSMGLILLSIITQQKINNSNILDADFNKSLYKEVSQQIGDNYATVLFRVIDQNQEKRLSIIEIPKYIDQRDIEQAADSHSRSSLKNSEEFQYFQNNFTIKDQQQGKKKKVACFNPSRCLLIQSYLTPSINTMNICEQFEIDLGAIPHQMLEGMIAIVPENNCERTFLMGGKYKQLVFEIDEVKLVGIQKCPMRAQQFQFGFGQLAYKNFIMVVGGFVDQEKDISQQFECYNIDADTWTQLPDCLYPVYQPSLCLFRDQWIFQFGGAIDQKLCEGRIQRFDLKLSQWQDVNYQRRDACIYPYQALMIQINPNQMLILGGYDFSGKQRSNQFYLLSYDEAFDLIALKNQEIFELEDFYRMQLPDYITCLDQLQINDNCLFILASKLKSNYMVQLFDNMNIDVQRL